MPDTVFSSLTPFLLALLLASCALRPPSQDAFAFGVVGDTPYNDREEVQFLAMIEQMNAEPLAFVVHIGDFKLGSAPCTDALFERRKAQFDRFARPLVYTPGDNEWADCRRRGADPLERLDKLRRIFFADRWSLGRERIETSVQRTRSDGCTAYPENRSWMRSGVVFVTLNITGSDNNVGFDPASDAEARCRDDANRLWLERAVAQSESGATRALVVAIQANPWFTVKPVYADFLAQMQRAAQRPRKPVLLVHGHTHLYRVDTPFTDAMGHPIPNLTRLETYGSPVVGWVRVTVDPEKPAVFGFEPKMRALTLP